MDSPPRSHTGLVPTIAVTVTLLLITATFVVTQPATLSAPTAAAPSSSSSAPAAPSRSDSLFPTIGNNGFDVEHYAIDLSYHHNGTVKAVTTITAEAPNPLTTFSLDFQGLTVSQVTTNGLPAHWTRSGHKLKITPAKPVSRRFTTIVTYSGTPETLTSADGSKEGWLVTDDGATVMAEPLGAMTWFPNNNTPTDKATFDITVQVPLGLEVAGNGDLASHHDEATTSTWVWQQHNPIATYLAMISIGQYQVFSSTMTLTDGRTVPMWSFVDKNADVPLATVDRLPQIIRNLESFFGPYPQSSAGIVIDQLDTGYSLETQNRPIITFDGDDWLLYHELAHQWFGDSVTIGDWSDIWLNEGLATYTEYVSPPEKAGELRGEAYYDATMKDALSTPGFWTTPPAPITDAKHLFSSEAVYTRGGLTLWALRKQVGERTFTTIIKTWTSQHRDAVVNTEQFTQLAEQISGKDLNGFFNAWLHTASAPTSAYR
jgi:aminopeptidase N